MNYKILKKINLKAVKYLTAVIVVCLTASIIFYSPNSLSVASPDCSTLGASANPGVNCTFLGLPTCKSIQITTDRKPRENCADLVDLPLCSATLSTVYPGKNCVKECSDASFVNPDGNASPALVRGVDYAVHNQHCIRFCDAPEDGFIQPLNAGGNCVNRKCHQLPNSVTPTSSNCTNLPCNLLTVDELKDPKFDFTVTDDYDPQSPDSAVPKKYCEGDNLKCFDFAQEKLHYVATRIRSLNGMCKRHNCPVASPSCATDEIKIINDKGAAYKAEYIKEITANQGLENAYFCEHKLCAPVVPVPYRCSNDASGNPTKPDTNFCDPGATCDADGFCNAMIDCNKDVNKKLDVCLVSGDVDTGTIGTLEDVNDSWFYRPKPMSKADLNMMKPEFCYKKWDFLHRWGWNTVIFGWFVPGADQANSTNSPGMCGVSKVGWGGEGYGYLCGTHGNLYTKVDDHVAYHKGYVLTDFTENDATYKVQVCARFSNALHPWDGRSESCGRRECAVSCGFSWCSSQACGSDVCRTLTVTDSNPQGCKMNGDLFGGNPDRECMARLAGGATANSYLRLRAVRYGNKICTFLDVKGQFAYKKMFLDGSEKISETMQDGSTAEYCLSGDLDPNSHACKGGKDSNDDQGEANKWRSILRIPYIQDNIAGSADGYLDKNGRFFPAQDCIKIPLRVAPPRFFNVATQDNSERLFTPQVYIVDAMTRKGGPAAEGANGNLGITDFNYPEIQVRVGLNTVKLSLALGKDGTETVADDAAVKSVSANIPDMDYTANLSVKKGYDSNNNPIFCLFEKITNSKGEITTTSRGCARRSLPEINNKDKMSTNAALPPRSVAISRISVPNQLNNSKLSLKYCTTPDNCTASAIFFNPDTTTPYCTNELEKYQLCSRRDECSALNVECMQNEVDMQVADNAGLPIGQFLNKRDECNNILLPYCNAKRGITNNTGASIIDQNPTASTNPDTKPKDNYYGWFNEICIVSGFESRLKQIIAKKTDNNAMGKCTIDPRSPYLTDNDDTTNCNDGGKAPNCLCLESTCAIDKQSPYLTDGNPNTNCDDGENGPHCLCLPGTQVYPEADEEVRFQTPREAGLCVDMPLPRTCQAIKYSSSPNPDFSDPYYTLASLNKSAAEINTSHTNRTNGTTYGHAEFPIAIAGTADVIGQCHGFWRYSTNASGVILKPRLNCTYDGDTVAWEASTRNPCTRYACNAVITAGPDESGIYQGGYSSGETDANVGKFHGYALWPAYGKTNDLLEDYSASSCIPGYKKSNSTTIKDAAGFITGYSGGDTPSRQCNQLGEFHGDVVNPCVPITCKGVTLPAIPANTNDWKAWQAMGGAVFEDIIASRSQVRAQNKPEAFNSVQVGTCKESLGFFKSPGGDSPTLECDSLGNWRNLRNPCVTRCSAISDLTAARNSNNGYAFWAAENSVPLGGEVTSTALSCASATNDPYVISPYPPLSDKYGNPFTIKDSSTYTGTYRTNSDATDGNRNIPDDVSLDTRSIGSPQRVCKSVIITGNSVNVWTGTSSNCVNRCSGSNTDSRIGVGVTKHILSTSTKDSSGKYNADTLATINWHDTALGGDDYYSSCGEVSGSHFIGDTTESNRNNNCYVLRRHCNANGKWDNPVPVCVAHGSSDPAGQAYGKIGNAFYTTGTGAGFSNSIAVTSPATTLTAQSCIDGFWTGRDVPAKPLPQRTCAYKDANQFIDQVYWKLSANAECTPTTCLPPEADKDIKNAAGALLFKTIGIKGADDKVITKGTDAEYRTIFTFGTAEVAAGSSITGACSQGEASSTIFTLRDITNAIPTKITCGNDGQWGAISNATACKKSCSIPAHSEALNANDCGGAIHTYLGAFSLAHGESTTFTACDTCTDGADAGYGWWYYASCTDGVPNIQSTTADHSENYSPVARNNSGNSNTETLYMCPIREYRPTTGWTSGMDYGSYGGQFFKPGNDEATVVRNYSKPFKDRTGTTRTLSNISSSNWNTYIYSQ